MWDILLISFRESFEAWLVMGIIITYLKTSGRTKLLRPAYLGALLGIAISLLLGITIFSEASVLSMQSKNIFEAVMMLLAAGLVGYFVVWMSHQNRSVATKVKIQVENSTTWVEVFLLSLLSVLREGVELTVFILTKVSSTPGKIVFVASCGLAVSLLSAYAIFSAASHYLLKYIFKLLGILLIFLGAEMFSEGILKILFVNSEEWEMVLGLLFVVPAFYIFFRNDFLPWRQSKKI